MSLGLSAAAWAGIGAIGSIGLGAYGVSASGNAADAQKKAANQNEQLAQQQFNAQLAMYEPTRALGYGATSDLSSLYGYAQPAYTPLNNLISGNFGGSSSTNPANSLVTVKGRKAKSSGTNTYGFGLTGGSGPRKFGAQIDPVTGTVLVNGQPERSAALTEYLRTGVAPYKFGGKVGRIVKQIDEMRANGYVYDPNAATAANQQTAGPLAPNGQTVDKGTSANGAAGNFGRFFTSPDYQFRQQEGTSALDRSAAARGSVLGGNQIKAQTEFSSNLASGEYGNYVNRLLAMAGLGQVAQQGAANASNNYTTNATNANTQAGDARASGILGQWGAVSGALSGIGSALGNYYGGNYGGYQPYSSAQNNSLLGSISPNMQIDNLYPQWRY